MTRTIKNKVLLFCLLIAFALAGCSPQDPGMDESAGEKAAEQPAMPESTEDQVSPFAYTPKELECTRLSLEEAVRNYIAAQETGDSSKMVFSSEAKFLENMRETTIEEGKWNTALPIAFHRSIYDAERCKTFSEVIVTEGENQHVIGTRLEVDKGEITEIDSFVTGKDDWLFNADDYLRYSSSEDWSVLHIDDRVSRQELIDAAHQYLDFVFMDKGVRPPWGAPCARLEGGAYTNPDKNDEDNCRIPGPLGDLFINDRTFVVDEELGAVNVFCRMGDSTTGMPDSHLFRLVNGRYRYIHTLNANPDNEPIEIPEFVPREPECNRPMLEQAVSSYINAQRSGDLSKMNLASNVEFIENMSETARDKGLWNTALPIALHRSIYDSGRCRTFSEVIVTEGENQYVIGTRLEVDKDEVTKIDSLITGEGDWLFDADDYLKFSKAEDWDILPLDDRVSRQELIDAANQYFDFVFMDKGIRPPWGAPCARLEGGELYTNRDNNDLDNCIIPGPLGELPIVDRSYVVDEEMGSVNVFCRFGASINGMPDSHLFRLTNGRYRYIHTLSVNLTGESAD